MIDSRIFIPEKCGEEIFKTLHHSYQGVDHTLKNARQTVHWHGISNDVKRICNSCKECEKYKQSNQKESLEADELPERPFYVVSADLFYIGKKVFMVYADRLSGYPMVSMWNSDPSTKQVIKVLQNNFSMFGKPLKFRSDGGSQFASREMKEFLHKYGIEHGQSSPYNPQSNGSSTER